MRSIFPIILSQKILVNAGFFGGNSPVLVEQTDTVLGGAARPPPIGNVQQFNYAQQPQVPLQVQQQQPQQQQNTQFLAVRQVGENEQEQAANALALANAQREAVMAQMNLVNTTTTTTTEETTTTTTAEPTSSTAAFDAAANLNGNSNFDLSGVDMSENADDTKKLTSIFAMDARKERIEEYNRRVIVEVTENGGKY